MGSKWRKVKLALGLNLCYYVPRTVDDDSPPPSEQFSDAALLSHRAAGQDEWNSFSSHPSTPPAPSSARFKFSKSSSKSSSQSWRLIIPRNRNPDPEEDFDIHIQIFQRFGRTHYCG